MFVLDFIFVYIYVRTLHLWPNNTNNRLKERLFPELRLIQDYFYFFLSILHILLLGTVSLSLLTQHTSISVGHKTVAMVTKANRMTSFCWNCLFLRTFAVLRPMQTDATSANNPQHCWVLLANNIASVCMDLKVWLVSNYTQQVPTLFCFHANGRNKSQHCRAQQCWVLLANNVGSVCMGL